MSTRTTRTTKKNSTVPRPIADHLAELRWRLAIVAIVFVVASSFAYNIRDLLVHVVMSPIGQQKLVYLTPAGGFSFIFSITLYAGVIATAPVLIYNLYRFIAPALPAHARRYSFRVILASILLLGAGVGFGYFVAIPAALKFLTTFAGTFVQANLTADSYLSFVVAYLLGLGVLFQLPLLLLFWNWVSPFQKGGLLATQQYVLIGSFIAAAMITPTPDVFNQTLIAMPIIVIYQLGVVAVFMMNRRARSEQRHRSTAPPKTVADTLVKRPAATRPLVLTPAITPQPAPLLQQSSVALPPRKGRNFDVVPMRTRTAGRAKPQVSSVSRSSAPRSARSVDGIRRPH